VSMIGTSVVRKEDPALLTVGGRYVDDLAPPDALHVVFVRSLMAHAEITGIDTAEAAAMPGVVGVFTAADLGLQALPPSMPMFNQAMRRSWLAADRVRYVGEPLAAVVAESRTAAEDAAELVFADYEPLKVVVDARRAAADEVLLFPEAGTNAVFALGTPVDDGESTGGPGGSEEAVGGEEAPDGPDSGEAAGDADDGEELPSETADPFADCEVVVRLSFANHRMAVAPIEPRAALAHWTPGDDGELRLTQWSCTQFPHRTRDDLAAAMGVDKDRVRVITPDVGGGFGSKNGAYPEDMVVAALARRLGRPLRWAETRSENMVGLSHARGLYYDAVLGGASDGRIKAYRLHVTQDAGAYPAIGSALPIFTRMMAPGVYAIDSVQFSSVSVATNTTPIGAYRGAGRPEATSALERMIDVFAAEAGLDPLEVRRRNLIPADAFPVVTATGADMDSGDYAAAIDAVAEAAGHEALRAEQQRRRCDPDAQLLGLGWSAYCEITNPMGASEFGSIELRDDGSALVLTGASSHGQGHHTAFAQIASEVTGISVEHIEVRHGDTDEVARGGGTGGLREEYEPLKVAEDFEPTAATFPFGVHLSVVEVDRDTGEMTVLRHVACDDAGTIVNPMIVDGQVHGGVAAGIGHTFLEAFVYDDDGNPLTANLMDYAMASAAELPSFERIVMETPTDRNPLGAKGIGESGTIGAGPAVHNAVVDALSHLGVRHIDMPLTPQRVWKAIHTACTRSQ